MIHLITGGSGSGKSVYGEEWLTKEALGGVPFFYVATMRPYGDEAHHRIERHQKQREGKGFRTIEKYLALDTLKLPANQGVLLECVSNWAANELYREDGRMDDPERVLERMRKGIRCLCGQTERLAVITNEVGADLQIYSSETRAYIYLMGEINRYLAQKAELVTEVVYGIPVAVKP